MRIGKSVTLIELQDWDKLVIDTYGKPYSFQQQDGCKERGIFLFTIPLSDFDEFDFENEIVEEYSDNYEPEQMGVSFEAWLKHDISQYGKIDWKRKLWFHRYFYPDVLMIINDLYKKGILKDGEYLINIDW